MWATKVSSIERAEKTAWQSVKRYAVVYYVIVFLLPFVAYLVLGKPNVEAWTFDPDDWSSHAPDLWWQLALALPAVVWFICKGAVLASYQQGIEDATRAVFGYSYFDIERWLIGKHVDLRASLRKDNGLDCEDALGNLKVEVEAKLAHTPDLSNSDEEAEALHLTEVGREQLRLENEESSKLTRYLARTISNVRARLSRPNCAN